MPDYSLPSYLEPPSPAQAEQLAIQKNEQETRQAQIFQTLFDRMQKRVAFTQMVGRANELQAAGIDPQDAKDQAFIDAAPKLFSGQPGEYASYVDQVSTRLQKRRAVREYKDKVQELTQTVNPETGENYTPLEATSAAWALKGPEISGNAGIGGFLGAQTRAETAKDSLKERSRHNKEMEDVAKKRAEDIQAAREAGLGFKYFKEQTDTDLKKEIAANQIESKEKIAEEKLDAYRKRFQSGKEKLPEAIKLKLQSLYKEYDAVNKALRENPTEKAPLIRRKFEIYNQISQVTQPTEMPAADATEKPKSKLVPALGQKFKYGDKTLIYRGGDPDEESSYVEER